MQAVKEFEVYARTDIAGKNVNEDQYININYEDGYLLGIFDGHSGSNAALYIKNKIVETLNAYKQYDWSKRLVYAIRWLAQEFLRPAYPDMSGSTVALAYVSKTGDVHVVNIGDSRIFVEIEGEIIQQDNKVEDYSLIKFDTLNKEFLTRRHNNDDENSPEVVYYKQKGYMVKDGYVSKDRFSTKFGGSRSFGDVYAPAHYIRDPEYYHWILTPIQMVKANIIAICDGFEAASI